jgi:hypothetical protein
MLVLLFKFCPAVVQIWRRTLFGIQEADTVHVISKFREANNMNHKEMKR